MSLESLVSSYGYLAVLLGTFLEGETILVLGGVAAKLGYLQLPWVMLCALVGSFLGDQLFFWLGRWKGPGLLARRPAWQRRATQVEVRLLRHQVKLILGFRFLYGLRTVTPFVVGMSAVPARRFLVLNLLGAVLWSVVIGGLGYLFGHALEAMLGDIRRYEAWLLGGVLLAGVLVWLVRRLRHSPD